MMESNMGYKPNYKESIYHLVFISNIISQYKNYIANDDNPNPKGLIPYFAVFSHLLLLTKSYLDEYDSYFQSDIAEENRKINSVKQVVKPAVDRLRRWKDLGSFRNNILAHSFRIREKDYMSAFLNDELHAYKVPQRKNEILVFADCVAMATEVIQNYFQQEYKDFSRYLQSTKSKNKRTMSAYDSKTAKKELVGIQDEINHNIQELNKKIMNPISFTFNNVAYTGSIAFMPSGNSIYDFLIQVHFPTHNITIVANYKINPQEIHVLPRTTDPLPDMGLQFLTALAAAIKNKYFPDDD